MTIDKARLFRLLIQAGSFIFIAVIAFRNRLGQTFDSCETLCPFGGAEGMVYFIKQKQYLCVLSHHNVALFFSLLLLAFVAGRIFCSHLCPLGFIFEKLNALRLKWGIRPVLPPPAVDKSLQALRYVVLIAILCATWYAGDLVFRGYDPYFALFSLHAHGIAWTSYIVLAVLVALALFIPMFWCRYLCPLGACMDPFSRLSLLKITRDGDACTHCGCCDRQCPMVIPVSQHDEVRDIKCSLCLECAAACPGRNVLRIGGPRKGSFLALWILPVLVIAFIVLSHALSPLFRVPTFKKTIKQLHGEAAKVKETTFIVEGLTCRGKSLMLHESLRYLPGVYEMETYASERKLLLRYDPESLDEKDIRMCIEGVMRDPETGIESAPFKVTGTFSPND